jgi:hypothetical protein
MPVATKVKVTELPGGNGSAVLAMPEGSTWLSQRFGLLFKRDFYDRFLENNLGGFANPGGGRTRLVIGTPGIGKSSFALYAVWWALQRGKTVVYRHYFRAMWYTVLTPGSDEVRGYEEPAEPPELKDPNAVYIVNGMMPQAVNAFTLFVTSPNRDRVHQWKKHPSTPTYHFPIWTRDELKLLRTHCYGGWSFSDTPGVPAVELTDEELQRRFDTVGGVPRYIVDEVNWCDVPAMMNMSIKETMKNIINQDVATALENEFDISHHTIHFIVSRDTFKIERMDFASPLALSLFSRKLVEEDRSVLLRVLKAARKQPELATLRGRIHESLVHQSMSSSAGMWTAQSLDSEGARLVPIPGRASFIYDRITDLKPMESDVPVLWRPRSKTNAAVDFIITLGRQVYFIQCTVSNTHDIVIRTSKSENPGLLQQADALAKNGFDTAGELNYVHVAEAETEPLYKKGRLIVGTGVNESNTVPSAAPDGSAAQLGSTEALADRSGTTQPEVGAGRPKRGRGRPRKEGANGGTVTAAEITRVKQYVFGFTPLPSLPSYSKSTSAMPLI